MQRTRPEPNRIHRPEDEPVNLAPISDPELTVVKQIRHRVADTPDRIGIRFRVDGPGEPARWATRTWGEFGAEAHAVAAGLVDAGVGFGDRVAILAGTGYPWMLADAGVMLAGAATTPLYPTVIDAELVHILGDSAAEVVFAEDTRHLEALAAHAGQLPRVREIIMLGGAGALAGEAAAAAVTATPARVRTFEELIARGRRVHAADPELVAARADRVRPADLCTLLYTSGTTGLPKGVRLSHRAAAYQGAATDTMGFVNPGDAKYLWLPMSHAFGKALIGACLHNGTDTTIDGDPAHLLENLPVARPHFIAAVPRLLEKIRAGVDSAMAEAGGVKALLYRRAIAVGGEYWRRTVAGEPIGAVLRLRMALADRLVFARIRERFGGRLRTIMCGAAPLSTEVADWFAAVGLPVYEGYGLSECGGAATANRIGAWRAGTVGWPMPGTEMRCADDGEVLIRGGGVMDGYHGLPEATAAAFDEGGWLRTGDIGEFDERGFLRITDRKKELFKTSVGKYVAPAKIEAAFGALCPYSTQLVVDGPGRKFVSALVALDEEAIRDWAAANGLGDLDLPALAAREEVRGLIAGYVERLNAGLAHWEQVHRFTILDRELSIERGEVTPTLKLRRRVILENFRELLDAHYR
ncbi:AMP-dependent synthetase/ligase [Corynebacterium sphenisci]|uniref:AMP-dependent synthetase/ligase n=1 Tax=Corynebacterium sphenisci TaxID=191493 RepID=UPI000953004B|nr:long-chain fatty acid--CoA ligase [Corynebacterium sphenisci]